MSETSKVRKLNSLRGIASLIVIVSHYSNATGIWGRKLGEGAGQLGVMLFFMLSAFLITYLYFDLPPTKKNIKNYLISRIARIAPLFLLVVIGSFIYKHYLCSPFGDYAYNISGFDSLLVHLLLFHGDSVLWSIQPEIFFYIFFIFAWLLSFYFPKIVLLCTALISILSLIFFSSEKFLKLNFLGFQFETCFFQVFPLFAVGLFFGYLFRKWKPPRKFCNHFFVLCLAIIPILFPNIFLEITGHFHNMWGDPLVLFCLSLVFFSIVFLVPSGNIFLENRLGDTLGSISFSLYLLHYPLLRILKENGILNGFYGAILFFSLSIFISFLTYMFYELPMRSLIRSYAIE